MKLTVVFTLTAAAFVLSCNKQEGTVTPPALESETFQASQLFMWADRQNVVLDVPINVTQKCRPLYSGKGYIRFTLLGGGRTVVTDSPVQDTLGNRKNSIDLPLEFQAGDLIQNWRIRLVQPSNIDYGFEASIRIDSILIDSRYYHIDSDEAKRLAPIGNRFRSFASTVDRLVFYYR